MTLHLTACGRGRVKGCFEKVVKMTRLAAEFILFRFNKLWINSRLLLLLLLLLFRINSFRIEISFRNTLCRRTAKIISWTLIGQNRKVLILHCFKAYGCLIESNEWPLNLILHSHVVRFIREPCLYGELWISYDSQYSHRHQRIEWLGMTHKLVSQNA